MFSYDYLVWGCGGMGVGVIDKVMCGGEIVLCFFVELDD